jgi:hypothetical protein
MTVRSNHPSQKKLIRVERAQVDRVVVWQAGAAYPQKPIARAAPLAFPTVLEKHSEICRLLSPTLS